MEGESEAEDKVCTVLDTALEVDDATAAQVASNPVSEKSFPFLQLPPEVRNMVYQQHCIYETPDSEMAYNRITFPDLRQAPITRVNKQIRNETLPIFYGNNNFDINISWPSEPSDLSNSGRDRFKHVWDLLHSFTTAPAPGAESMMQTSSLRFLTELSFRVDENFSSDDTILVFGFTMSSKKLYAGKWEHYIQVKNLDWERFAKVNEAYVANMEFELPYGDMQAVDFFRSCEAKTRIDELVSLMCFMARQCPQLRRSVLGIVEGYEESGSDMSD